MEDAKYGRGNSIITGSLYRRVPPDAGCFPRGVDQLPSRQAFEPKRGDPGISAYLVEETTEDLVLAGHEGFALVEIAVENVTSRGFTVTYEPKDGEIPGHVLVAGPFSSSNCKALSQSCRVRQPGDPVLWRERLAAKGRPPG